MPSYEPFTWQQSQKDCTISLDSISTPQLFVGNEESGFSTTNAVSMDHNQIYFRH
jgi:hypothetical protein